MCENQWKSHITVTFTGIFHLQHVSPYILESCILIDLIIYILLFYTENFLRLHVGMTLQKSAAWCEDYAVLITLLSRLMLLNVIIISRNSLEVVGYLEVELWSLVILRTYRQGVQWKNTFSKKFCVTRFIAKSSLVDESNYCYVMVTSFQNNGKKNNKTTTKLFCNPPHLHYCIRSAFITNTEPICF